MCEVGGGDDGWGCLRMWLDHFENWIHKIVIFLFICNELVLVFNSTHILNNTLRPQMLLHC